MNPRVTYDEIGNRYSKHRRADPRIVDAILNALNMQVGDVIAEIGAGTGNYSNALADRGFQVHAIEPSEVMRSQATGHSHVCWVSGVAENIPLATNSVDAVVAINSLHHFQSMEIACGEMIRIASGPILIFTHDPRLVGDFWFTDYFPEIIRAGYSLFPPLSDYFKLFERVGMKGTVSNFDFPRDLCDLFLPAGWCRPELYLAPNVRASMSAFALADQEVIEAQVDRLRTDLASGDWDNRYGSIRNAATFDAGYRLLVLTPTISLRKAI